MPWLGVACLLSSTRDPRGRAESRAKRSANIATWWQPRRHSPQRCSDTGTIRSISFSKERPLRSSVCTSRSLCLKSGSRVSRPRHSAGANAPLSKSPRFRVAGTTNPFASRIHVEWDFAQPARERVFEERADPPAGRAKRMWFAKARGRTCKAPRTEHRAAHGPSAEREIRLRRLFPLARAWPNSNAR